MPKKTDPNDFTTATIKVLANRSAQTCSNPGCRRPTSGPHSNKDKNILVGEGAHIFGKSLGSARFNPNMTPEERRDISNGIWLCNICHKMIDSDESIYPVVLLKKWKKDFEKEIINSIISVNNFKKWGSTQFKIIIINNPTNQQTSDIYIKDGTKDKVFFASVKDVFKDHYHNSEYSNGNLFLICRTGGGSGYEKNPDWKDELWKYDQEKKAVMIFSGKGIDFKASSDDYIALSVGKENNENYESDFYIIKYNGETKIKLDLCKIFNVQFWNIIGWSKDVCWLSVSEIGPYINSLITVNSVTEETKIYRLPNIIGPDLAFSPDSLKILFSDFPVFYDVGGHEDFIKSKQKVVLKLYDLVKKTIKIVDMSEAKKFNPKWKNKSQFEYDDPNSKKIILKHVKN